jgi:hypothetical protein
LVKISGDMLTDPVFDWIMDLDQEYVVTICVGGGTQINKAFRQAGLTIREFGPLGRPTPTLEEQQLARRVLGQNQAIVQKRLVDLGVHANVVIPAFEIDGVFCHLNGDQYLLAAYHGFYILYAVTALERLENKSEQFAPYPKIKVVGF